MITRYALFEGTIADDAEGAFRAAVLAELVPTWRAVPGAVAVRVTFADGRDEGAPSIPLILAVDYPDRAALDLALASPERLASRTATAQVMGRFFTGRIHHHVTAAHAFPAGD
jgi:hypothetical protein